MESSNENKIGEVPSNTVSQVEANLNSETKASISPVKLKENTKLRKILLIIGTIIVILILTFSTTFSLAKGNPLSYIGSIIPLENIPVLKQLSPPPIQTLYFSIINKDSYKLDSDFTNKVTFKLKNIPELGDKDLQIQFTNDFDNDSKINTGVINFSTDYKIPEIGDAKDLQLDWNAEMSKGNYYFKFNDKLLDVLSNTLETFKQSSNNEIEEINYIQSLKGELMEKSLLVSTEPMQEYFDNLANSWTGLMDGIGASPNSVDTNSLSKEDQKAIQDKAFQIYDKYNFDEEVFILLKSLNFEYLNRENYNDKKAILVSVKFDDKSLLDGVKKANNNFAEKISHNKKSFVNDVCDYGILVAKAINNNSENDNNTQLEDCIKEYTANLDIYLDEMNDPIIKADRDKEMDKLVENKSFNVSLTFYIDAFNGMILGTKTILNSFESDYNFVIEHEFNRKSTKTEPILEKVLDIKDIIKKLDEIRNVNKQDEIKKITKALIVCPNLLDQNISNATIDSFGESVDITFDTKGKLDDYFERCVDKTLSEGFIEEEFSKESTTFKSFTSNTTKESVSLYKSTTGENRLNIVFFDNEAVY
jgi:hypothetical protein